MRSAARFLILFFGLTVIAGCARDGEKGKNSEKDRPTPADVKKDK
jgi:hypothetical protein